MTAPNGRNGSVATPIDALPPALPAMWRMCKLGYRHEPSLMFWAFILSLVAAVPDALLALWLALLAGAPLRSPGEDAR